MINPNPLMRRMFFVLVLTGLVCGTAAERLSAKEGPIEKLDRGLTNIVTGPGELYTQPILTSGSHNSVLGLCAGFFKGVGMFVAREAVGIYDVVTFPVPFPKNYRRVFYPDTTFTDWEIRQP